MYYKNSGAFSLVEILFCIVVIGILGASALYSVNSIKKQDVSIQKFLLQDSSIYETQMFINKILNIANADSIQIAKDSISWEGYDKLFLSAVNNNEYMDFSLKMTQYSLVLKNGNMYFNNEILLHNVKSFSVKITNINTDKILEYTLCAKFCISDFIFLEEKEIIF